MPVASATAGARSQACQGFHMLHFSHVMIKFNVRLTSAEADVCCGPASKFGNDGSQHDATLGLPAGLHTWLGTGCHLVLQAEPDHTSESSQPRCMHAPAR
jgi:hypothetical protein